MTQINYKILKLHVKYTSSLKLQEKCDEETISIDNGNCTCKQIMKKAAARVIKKEGKEIIGSIKNVKK